MALCLPAVQLKQSCLFPRNVFRSAGVEILYRAPVAQLVEHRAAMRKVVSSTPARPTLRVFK